MTNKKQLINFLFICIFLTIFNANTFPSWANTSKINSIIEIVKKDSKKSSLAKQQISQITIDLFDYNYFFNYAIPHIWQNTNASEKNKITKIYNEKFINKYFSELISCQNLHATLQKRDSEILCTYTCDNNYDNKADYRPQTIRFVMRGDKVIDMRLRGMSFLRNEGGSLKNEYSRKTKEQFMNNL